MATLELPIDGRERDGYVKRNAMLFGQNGFGVGPNFVGNFPRPAQGAVAADYDQVDLASLHEVSGGVVSDDLVGEALLSQLPGCQMRSLRTWAGLSAEAR